MAFECPSGLVAILYLELCLMAATKQEKCDQTLKLVNQLLAFTPDAMVKKAAQNTILGLRALVEASNNDAIIGKTMDGTIIKLEQGGRNDIRLHSGGDPRKDNLCVDASRSHRRVSGNHEAVAARRAYREI